MCIGLIDKGSTIYELLIIEVFGLIDSFNCKGSYALMRLALLGKCANLSSYISRPETVERSFPTHRFGQKNAPAWTLDCVVNEHV